MLVGYEYSSKLNIKRNLILKIEGNSIKKFLEDTLVKTKTINRIFIISSNMSALNESNLLRFSMFGCYEYSSKFHLKLNFMIETEENHIMNFLENITIKLTKILSIRKTSNHRTQNNRQHLIT